MYKRIMELSKIAKEKAEKLSDYLVIKAEDLKESDGHTVLEKIGRRYIIDTIEGQGLFIDDYENWLIINDIAYHMRVGGLLQILPFNKKEEIRDLLVVAYIVRELFDRDSLLFEDLDVADIAKKAKERVERMKRIYHSGEWSETHRMYFADKRTLLNRDVLNNIYGIDNIELIKTIESDGNKISDYKYFFFTSEYYVYPFNNIDEIEDILYAHYIVRITECILDGDGDNEDCI